jgi:hypothetical protein
MAQFQDAHRTKRVLKGVEEIPVHGLRQIKQPFISETSKKPEIARIFRMPVAIWAGAIS